MSRKLTRRSVLLGATLLATAGIGSAGFRWLARPDADPLPVADADWLAHAEAAAAHLQADRVFEAASALGHLTDIALSGAQRTIAAWMGIRHEYGGLFPRKLDSASDQIWNYRDCAADLYCHLVLGSMSIAPENLPQLKDLLQQERTFSQGLPDGVDLVTGKPLGLSDYWRMFGAVEYVKDGLLPILERFGPTDWLGRMHEIVTTIIAQSTVTSDFGNLPSSGTEKNGEFLQVLARLYQRERRAEYLVAGRAIAEAYTKEVLPACDYIPAQEWDFRDHRAMTPTEIQRMTGRASDVSETDGRLRLRDHGNEIIGGLVEWLIAESVAPDSRAQDYAPAIERMLDEIILRGRDRKGIWAHFAAATEEPAQPQSGKRNDNWGYLSAAYVAYDMLQRQSGKPERYAAEIERTVQAVLADENIWWNGKMDGYADAIEGPLYLLANRARSAGAAWLDREMGRLVSYQKPDGFVIRTYLDGNFVRTSLLYALFRSQGITLQPWKPGIRMAAIRKDDTLYISVKGEQSWQGKLVFDHRRDQENMGLSFDYPRLNSWPQWFVPDEESLYDIKIERASGSTSRRLSGRSLRQGIDLQLKHEEIRLKINPVPDGDI